MKKYKYKMMGGFAFSEKSDMEKLKSLAKKGWILDGSTFIWYRFKKGEPQDLDFAVDYHSEADDDYFAIFENAGWTHVLSVTDEIHIFLAPEGTKPIYTDPITESEKYKSSLKQLKKPSIISVLFFIILNTFFCFYILPTKGAWRYVFLVLAYFSFVAVIFTVMPYLGYLYHIRKLKKQENNN
ncbi:MAG: DUF2812 domain-containing protein [Bacillota bacterium]